MNWIFSNISVRNSNLANVFLRLKLRRWQPGQSWESSVGFEDVIPRILVCPLSYFAHLCHRKGQLREMNCLTANTWVCVCVCVCCHQGFEVEEFGCIHCNCALCTTSVECMLVFPARWSVNSRYIVTSNIERSKYKTSYINGVFVL
jgi:hypothetical protein